jgi:hypothetical protein
LRGVRCVVVMPRAVRILFHRCMDCAAGVAFRVRVVMVVVVGCRVMFHGGAP